MSVCVSYFAIVFALDDAILIIVCADDRLRKLLVGDGHVHFGELALVDAFFAECAFDDLDEGRAIAEFYFAARAKLLSVLEEALV